MSRTLVTEATALATQPATERGVVPLDIITPGWGSSGYYSAKVLENAATARVFPKGTHMYLDHPGEGERYDRPERSVRDLVAVLQEDATWNGSSLAAEAKIFSPYRDLFRDQDFVDAVGVSIRASADTTVGEAEGRKGTIITELAEAKSVDFVTKAGRGGRITAVLESARGEARETAVSETREQLQALLQAAYGAEKTWVWLRDFDPARTIAWFDIETDGKSITREQTYTTDGTSYALAGDPIEVRVRTEYVPVPAPTEGATRVPAPAGRPITQESNKEDTMPEISEAQLANLTEAAGRVPTLESEREQAMRERDEAREALARRDRSDLIARTIDAVEGADTLTSLERDGLAARVPDGDVDEAALTTAVTAAVQEAAQRNGAGRVRGMGAPEKTVTVAESTASILDAFSIKVQED